MFILEGIVKKKKKFILIFHIKCLLHLFIFSSFKFNIIKDVDKIEKQKQKAKKLKKKERAAKIDEKSKPTLKNETDSD
jgi:hypothetical protein